MLKEGQKFGGSKDTLSFLEVETKKNKILATSIHIKNWPLLLLQWVHSLKVESREIRKII